MWKTFNNIIIIIIMFMYDAKFTELVVVPRTIQCVCVATDDYDDDKSWLVVYIRSDRSVVKGCRHGAVGVEGTACRIQNDVWRHVVAAASSSIVTRSREWWMGGCHIYPATGGWMYFFCPPSLSLSLALSLHRVPSLV